METSEAAAALLNMESPNNILDEKRMSMSHTAGTDGSVAADMYFESKKRLTLFMSLHLPVKFTPTVLCWRPT